MNTDKVELIIKLRPAIEDDPYRDSVITLLQAPRWYKPIQRYRYKRDFKLRVYVVMAEYAKELIGAFTQTNTQNMVHNKIPNVPQRTRPATTITTETVASPNKDQ